MKVKSFTAGLVEGYGGAIESLDKQLKEKLGENIKIYSLQDTLYKKESPNDYDSRIVRVVIYDTLDSILDKK